MLSFEVGKARFEIVGNEVDGFEVEEYFGEQRITKHGTAKNKVFKTLKGAEDKAWTLAEATRVKQEEKEAERTETETNEVEVVENTTDETTEEVVEETTEDAAGNVGVDEVGIATTITQRRWISLKVTVEDIAEEYGVSIDDVNNVIASETYLDVIHTTFVQKKSWRTWAKKGSKIVAKRLWITEEVAQRFVDGALAHN